MRSVVPRLAIVITAVGTIESLEGTLVSVLENRPDDCEVVVALNQEYADPYDLRDEVRFLPPTGRKATVAAINTALAATRAPFVHLLASGCLVSEGWADVALARFDRRTAAVVPLVLDADDSSRIVAAGVGYHQRGQRYLVGRGQTGLDAAALKTVRGPGLFAAFYRKAALDIVGGFSTQLGPRQADVDLAMLLSTAGFDVAVEHGCCVRAGEGVDAGGSAFREALSEERLFWRNSGSAGGIGKWLNHAALVAQDVGRRAPRPSALAALAGRAWGFWQPGYTRHRRLQAELAARAVPQRLESDNLRFDRSHAGLGRSKKGRRRSSAI